MRERLKQIWGGFAGKTERRLTGGGIENINVPSRRDYAGADEQFLPQNFTPPAEAAFAALKGRLSAQEQKLAKKYGKTRSVFGEPPAPLSADAGIESAPDAAKDLIKGLRATEARVARRLADYADSDAAVALGRKRKKLFGLF